MYEVEEALEGSLRAGKSRGGRAAVWLDLHLAERTVYKLQRLLESLAQESKVWFEIRDVVLLSEEVRKAVLYYQQGEEREFKIQDSRVEAGGRPGGV